MGADLIPFLYPNEQRIFWNLNIGFLILANDLARAGSGY
jgi:hypothetical protein